MAHVGIPRFPDFRQFMELQAFSSAHAKDGTTGR